MRLFFFFFPAFFFTACLASPFLLLLGRLGLFVKEAAWEPGYWPRFLLLRPHRVLARPSAGGLHLDFFGFRFFALVAVLLGRLRLGSFGKFFGSLCVSCVLFAGLWFIFSRCVWIPLLFFAPIACTQGLHFSAFFAYVAFFSVKLR